MTEADQIHFFITEFCNQMARVDEGLRDLHSFYLFSDKRPGSFLGRFNLDSKSWADYNKMYQV